jgi:hypothetical protein
MLGVSFGLDPSGAEAAVLCLLTCSALIAVIFLGFALSSRFLRSVARRPPSRAQDPHVLGVVALWRLDRELRAGRPVEPQAEAPARGILLAPSGRKGSGNGS